MRLSYVKRLRRALAKNGIPFDRKKFSPHITLIRRAEYDQRRSFPGVDIPDASMQVSDALLMRSDRTKSRMVYISVSADHIYVMDKGVVTKITGFRHYFLM